MTNIWNPSQFLVSAVLLAVASLTPAQAVPQPGDVYREYTRVNLGSQWRVTDPAAGAAGAQDFLPNPVLSLDVDDLDGAVRAELLIDLWGGHVGTTGKQFRFNGNGWIDIPELSTTPDDPQCYMHQWNVTVDLPLSHLVEGVNAFEGTSGGQTCFSFNWGQWGWFSVTVRVYYDASKPHPAGSITWPVDGAVLDENPGIVASASSASGIAEVQYLAWFDGYDTDGDGVYLEYHRAYHRGKFDTAVDISQHVGTVQGAPFAAIWDTSRVPDQPPGGIKLQARFRDNDGIWFVANEVVDLSLLRADSVLKLYKAQNVPQRFWSRVNRVLTSEFVIPPGDALADATAATLLLTSYNGIDAAAEEGEEHSTRVNAWATPEYGADHHYQYDEIDVPLSELLSGTNTVTLNSQSTHHGMEIFWPGPALLVEYAATQAVCGNGVLEANEACDDGNTSEGDGCDATCAGAPDAFLLLDKTPTEGEVRLDWTGGAVTFEVGRSTIPTDVYAVPNVIGTTEAGQWFDSPPAGQLFHYRVRERCGNDRIDPGEDCDDGNSLPFDGCRLDCTAPACGDGVFDPGEGCDDGNVVNGDGCDENCMLSACGNGAVDPGEECDLGALNSDEPNADCRTDCMSGGCGDGILDDGEDCDDGNTADGDGCSSVCVIETTCGDGNVEPGEDCDEGAENSDEPDASCRTDCTPARCGDSIVDGESGETCDDGNVADGDGCSSVCKGIVSDDFSPGPNPGWRFEDPQANSTLSFSGPGTADALLHIDIPAGLPPHDAWTVNDAARYMQDVDDSDFEVEIKIQTSLTAGNQMQGIFVEHDADDWIRFDFVADGVDWKVFAATTTAGTPTARINVPIGPVGSPVPLYLRVQRQGNTWTQSYSTDPGDGWTVAGTFSYGLPVTSLGLFAGTAGPNPPALQATFDYFFETGAPVAPEDPISCGDGTLDPWEECDDGNTTDGDGCQGDCLNPVCGDGIVDAGEECDDGNTTDGDGCQGDCKDPVCGDGIVDAGEECDDGNTTDGDGCQGDCKDPVCGDGIVDAGEACDDGNTIDGDGCSSTCAGETQLVSDDFSPAAAAVWYAVDPLADSTFAIVGPGTADSHLTISIPAGTVHDAWTTNNAARYMQPAGDLDFEVEVKIETSLTADTQMQGIFVEDDADTWIRFDIVAKDGDWKVFAATRDGGTPVQRANAVMGPVGSPNPFWLKVGRSGDDWTYSYSEDPGGSGWTPAANFNFVMTVQAVGVFAGTAGASPPALTAAFDYFFDTAAPVVPEDPISCGDGTLDPWEECDDGNTTDGDGCQGDCLDPVCGDGIVDAGEECDDGNTTDGDGCQGDCMNPVCGDGILDAGEECDDGNTTDGDGCQGDCKDPVCGDGIVDAGEECDDGNTTDGDGCQGDCKNPVCGDGIVDAGEFCDDGNTVGGDGCSATCGNEASLVSDDFSPEADPVWNAVDPLADSTFAIVGPGTADSHLTISIPAGTVHDAWTTNNAARYMQAAADANFEVEVKIETSLTADTQMQGIFVEDDADTWIRFDIVAKDGDWKVFAATRDGGTPVQRANAVMGPVGSPNPFWLKVGRSGNDWTYSYSEDPGGSGWTPAANFNFVMTVQAVGVFAGTAGASPPALTAAFDYFFDTAAPVVPEDPISCGDGTLDPWEECDDGNTTDGDGCQGDCLNPVCGDGIVDAGEECDDGNTTDGDGCQGDCLDPVCGDGIVDAGEECDDGNTTDGDGCQGDCKDPVCGDGIVDAGEECDDGNTTDGDGCQGDCKNPVCGDGIVDAGEFCDDGNTVGGDGCSATCGNEASLVSDDFSPEADPVWNAVDPLADSTFAIVGPGTADSHLTISIPAGTVHDAWTMNNAARYMQAAADANFEVEVKIETSLTADTQMQGIFVEDDADTWIRFDIVAKDGDWKVFAATRDGGTPVQRANAVMGPVGSPNPFWLKVGRSGNDWTYSYSEDPGGSGWTPAANFNFVMTVQAVGVFAGTAGASPPALTAAFDYFFDTAAPVVPEDPISCGDGTLDPWEECDDGNTTDGDGCQGNCLNPVCGDGIVDAGEECDDGNTTDGDGCQGDCLNPVCGDGIVDAGEECDDGNTIDGDGCQGNCKNPVCGDGIVDAGEECDDGNTTDGDGCQGDCKNPVCGDGILDPGEGCDDGNTVAGDGCSATCGNENSVVSDDFSPAADPVWYEVDPLADSTFAIVGPGTADSHLTISIPAGTVHDAWTINNAARYMQAVDDSNFEVEVKIETSLTEDTQMQGIFVEDDADTWIRFDIVSREGDWKVFAATRNGGAPVQRVNTVLGEVGSPNPLWLQVQRTGNDWTYRYSTDPVGNGWTQAGNFNFVMTVQAIGVFAGTAGSSPPALTAAFDYFFETAMPVVPEDPVSCGDGTLDPWEECDDGNTTDGDGCQGNCRNPVCGDGIVDPGEGCDDGNTMPDDGCSAVCLVEPFCGDGTVNPALGEECDDGENNSEEADADCRMDCQFAGCGDGVVDTGEECDDDNNTNGDGCQGNCMNPVCGDLIVDAGQGEECDDGNTLTYDGCRNDCTAEQCGDGTLDPNEECDDDNTSGGDGCSALCTIESALCGNGSLDPGEDCDDGGKVSGDGCSASCKGLVSDDFDPAPNPGWTFFDPHIELFPPVASSFSSSGGGTADAWLTISVPGASPGIPNHDAWRYNAAPRLMQIVDDSDFTLEVKFESSLNLGNQMQGVLVEQDGGTWIRFDAFSDGTNWHVFAATMDNHAQQGRVNVSVAATASPAPLYLQVERLGDQWTLSYTTDPDSPPWTVAGSSFSFPMTVRSAGVFAGNATVAAPAVDADFDYFFDANAPIVPEDTP